MPFEKSMNSSFLRSLPKKKVLSLPKFFFYDRVYLPDESLIYLQDYEQDICSFRSFLKKFSLDHKLVVLDRITYQNARWKANIDSVNKLKNCSKETSVSDKDFFYFQNYLNNRVQTDLAKELYLDHLYKEVGLTSSGQNILSWFFVKMLSAIFFFAAPFLLIIELLRKAKLSFQPPKKKEVNVFLDYTGGVNFQEDSETLNKFEPGDGFFVDNEFFKLSETAFIAFGWEVRNKRDVALDLKKHGSFIFGEKYERTVCSIFEVLYLLRFHLKLLFKVTFRFKFTVDPRINYRIVYYKFLYVIHHFRAMLSLNNVRAKAYFSRMDYSYLHHCLASACRHYGVTSFGVCHSPGAGPGHTAGISFISFDHFFCYSSFFRDKVFPTWKNSLTQLHEVGVWRSDFSIAIQESEYFKIIKEKVSKAAQGKKVILIHLPVPETCNFRKVDTIRWLNTFRNIITKNTQLYFILIPRRYEGTPSYFKSAIDDFVNELDNVSLSQTLAPEWRNSYGWTALADLTIGCIYSDSILESWSLGIPAVSYADIGKGQIFFEELDSHLSLYNEKEIQVLMERFQRGDWPDNNCQKSMRRVTGDFVPGVIRDSMKATIKEFSSRRASGQGIYY